MIDHPHHAPLHRFPLLHSSKPAEVRDLFVGRFGATDFALDPEYPGRQTTVNHAWFKTIDIGYADFGGAVDLHLPPVDMVKQYFCRAQTGEIVLGRKHYPIDGESTCVAPSGSETCFHLSSGFTQLRLRVDDAALRSKLSAMTGSGIIREITFATPSTFRNPELRRLRRLIEFLVAELDGVDEPMSRSAIAGFEQAIVTCFLTANPHNFTHLLEREPSAPAPAQIRLVEDYIEANWRSAISIEALAAMTGASARSLFKAFKKRHGISPMAFVQNVRLQHARRMLESPSETISIIEVAATCGFFNPGHFARYYRRAFGELPKATLVNARRKRRNQKTG